MSNPVDPNFACHYNNTIMNSDPDTASTNDRHSTDRDSSVRRTELETQLETYKNSLTEIYDLYDKKIEELSLIRRIGDSIRSTLDLETLCRRVIEAVAHEISVDRVGLMVLDPDRKQLLLRTEYDAGQDEARFHQDVGARRLPPDRGEIGRAMESGQPVLRGSVARHEDPCAPADGPPVSLILLPLIARDSTTGMISLSRSAAHPFETNDVRILTILADQAAAALANVRLFNELAAANIRLRESERQARQTSLYLESLLETANDVVFTLDDRGRIHYVNSRVETWGYRKEDLSGLFFKDLLAAQQTPKTPADLPPLLPDQVLEVNLRTSTGGQRSVLLSTSSIEGDRRPGHDGPTRLVLARDITERKQLEKQLFHSEKLASIGILAAGVAHEVGNPLSAISGYTQILMGGDADEDERREYLNAIEEQTRRIQRIIEDLLNYSRPSAGHQSDINLSEALPQILSMLAAQRTFKNVSLEYDFPENPPWVNMDRDHLAQMVINIALNAVQAMPDGGRLRVALARPAGEIARIILSDTGPGIPQEIQDHVFDPFFTTKQAGQGTGLGLAICHRIVESYKGVITIQSGPDGTTFFIDFPALDV